MKYLVSGAERETGKEKTATVDAASEDQAMRIASKWGWLVSDIRAMSGFEDPQPPKAEPAPEYGSIVTVALVLQIMGFFQYVFAAFAVALGVIAFARDSGFPQETRIVVLCSAIVTAIGLLAAGAVLQMLGALALAHRDLVRNSFH